MDCEKSIRRHGDAITDEKWKMADVFVDKQLELRTKNGKTAYVSVDKQMGLRTKKWKTADAFVDMYIEFYAVEWSNKLRQEIGWVA